jgi:uroporphyrinogen-III synthase
MPTVLSTKKLKENQRSLLLNGGVSLVEYDAIKIDFVPFKVPGKIENAIFTSQNAVNAVMSYELGVRSCFCVGEKTKQLLEENGFLVIKKTEYASELAEYLVKYHKDETFHFFCGNIRSNEIPSKLKSSNITFEEIEVYKTTLTPKKFDRTFDAILFYSPSGVRSYCEVNLQGGRRQHLAGSGKFESVFVCIGKTTASEARKYTENVLIANATTVESVIAKAVKILREI